MSKAISDRLLILETKFETFQEEFKELKREMNSASVNINNLPNTVAKMIKDAFEEYQKNSSEKMKLTLSPIIVKESENADGIHKLRNRVQVLEFMKWQAIGIITGVGLIVNILIKYVF
jgi:DNA anti-recombination protein RmuC